MEREQIIFPIKKRETRSTGRGIKMVTTIMNSREIKKERKKGDLQLPSRGRKLRHTSPFIAD